MKTQVLEGSKQEIAAQVTKIHGRIVKAILYVDDIKRAKTGATGPGSRLTDAQFKQLMTEAQADTVAVGHFDDSREAMYTRMEGE